MTKTRKRTIRQMAISELERLSTSLDVELAANMGIEEIGNALREMGVDPHQLHCSDLDQMLSETESQVTPGYVYVSDELLQNEGASDEARILVLRLRHLTRQQRYEEALRLAERATQLAPDYWRAWISYAGLLVQLGDIDKAEAIYLRVRDEFSNDPKALAAAIHNCAGVKEIRCKLNPSPEHLLEISRLYQEALKFDPSRANTRACLLINSLLSGHINEQLFEDSVRCEGFFEAMSLEVAERGARKYAAKMYRILPALPMWFRDQVCGSGSYPTGIEALA